MSAVFGIGEQPVLDYLADAEKKHGDTEKRQIASISPSLYQPDEAGPDRDEKCQITNRKENGWGKTPQNSGAEDGGIGH